MVQKSEFHFIFENGDPSLGKSPGNFQEHSSKNRVFLDVVGFGFVFPFVIYLLHFYACTSYFLLSKTSILDLYSGTIKYSTPFKAPLKTTCNAL